MFNYDQLISRLSPEPPKGPAPLNLIGRIGEGIDEAVGKETELKAKIRAAAVEAAQKQAEEANQQAFELRKLELESKLAGGREGRERSWRSGEAAKDRAARLKEAYASADKDKGPSAADIFRMNLEVTKDRNDVVDRPKKMAEDLWGIGTVSESVGGNKGGARSGSEMKLGPEGAMGPEALDVMGAMKILGTALYNGAIKPEDAEKRLHDAVRGKYGDDVIERLSYETVPFVKETYAERSGGSIWKLGFGGPIHEHEHLVSNKEKSLTRFGRYLSQATEYFNEAYNRGQAMRNGLEASFGGGASGEPSGPQNDEEAEWLKSQGIK